MPSSDVAEFQRALSRARFVTVLTGAGISAESGIPTFRGAGGMWRTVDATQLASPDAWARDPGLVWEFYNYRRGIVQGKEPNAGHRAIAELQRRLAAGGRGCAVVTQNIDDLHEAAGATGVTHLHGSIWHVRCTACGAVMENRDVPITPAYAGSGAPEPGAPTRHFGPEDLPQCPRPGCDGWLRPHVVWFGEELDERDLQAAGEAALNADLFVVVGTSAVVYPAASFAPLAQQAGATLAEVNLEVTPATSGCDFAFQGRAGEILPELIGGF